MTNIQEVPSRIAAGVKRHLADERKGRRSVRWLAERADLRLSTVSEKLAKAPERFTIGELCRIADVLGVDLVDLYAADENLDDEGSVAA